MVEEQSLTVELILQRLMFTQEIITINQFVMDEDLLVKMEHSDGFNIVNVNLERNDLLFHTTNEKVALNLVSGRRNRNSNAVDELYNLCRKKPTDRPHFSGLGAQVFIAPEAIFFKKIFVRYTVQGGFC